MYDGIPLLTCVCTHGVKSVTNKNVKLQINKFNWEYEGELNANWVESRCLSCNWIEFILVLRVVRCNLPGSRGHTFELSRPVVVIEFSQNGESWLSVAHWVVYVAVEYWGDVNWIRCLSWAWVGRLSLAEFHFIAQKYLNVELSWRLWLRHMSHVATDVII